MPPLSPPPAAPSLPMLPRSFLLKKSLILNQLAAPAAEYDDASPKGSVDEGIRELMEWINGEEGWVTTSSCAGRVAVFVEGRKKNGVGIEMAGEREGIVAAGGEGETDGLAQEGEREGGEAADVGAVRSGRETQAGVGGKGGGGKWLFVSHAPVDLMRIGKNAISYLGMQRLEGPYENAKSFAGERLIHFKFEPMILHIFTASLSHAQNILSAALQAGFRESGAINLTAVTSEGPMPMVAIRSTGLALDSIIGRYSMQSEEERPICVVPEGHLEGLLAVANERFEENSRRIMRLWELLRTRKSSIGAAELRKKTTGGEWEDAAVRRERKRAEGLKKSRELKEGMGAGANDST